MSKKEQLIKVATELVALSGYDNISVKEITEKANVAKGTFYTYFKQKEDIISEITKPAFENISNEAKAIKGSIEEKIKHFLILSAREVEDIGIEICRAWLANSIKLENKVGIYDLQFYIDRISDFLDSAIKTGELSKEIDTNQLTEDIVATYYGFMNLWCITDKKVSLKNSVKNFCNYTLPKIL